MFKTNGDNKLLDNLHSGTTGDLSQKIDKEHFTDMARYQENEEKNNLSPNTERVMETIYTGAETITNKSASNNTSLSRLINTITKDGALSNTKTEDSVVKVEESTESFTNNKYASTDITVSDIKDAFTIGDNDNSKILRIY